MPAPETPGVRDKDQHVALLDELTRAERRAFGFELASSIAHMIGTPLHVISGRASLIRGAPNDASVADNARRIEEQVEKLAARMKAFIAYLTLPEAAAARESADTVLETALALCESEATARGVSFVRASPGPAEAVVPGSTTLLVLTRLCAFASRIAPSGATVSAAVAGTEDGRAAFSLDVPDLEPPKGRLESLEPPAAPEALPREELQLLSLAAAIARRRGGSVEVVAGSSGSSKIRYVTARTG